MGLPQMITNNTVDIAHTVHYAVGYLTKVNPRLAMVTHTAYDEDLLPEILAGIRCTGTACSSSAPDGVVVNVTKEAVWTCNAALGGGQPGAAEPLRGQGAVRSRSHPSQRRFPRPPAQRHRRPGGVRPREGDRPDLYYPEDVKRDLVRVFPKGFKIEIRRWSPRRSARRSRARPGTRRRHGPRPRPGSARRQADPGDRAHRVPRRQDDPAQPHPQRRPWDEGRRLVNDFGSINIDADLVVDVESDVISLANGCVCCSIRDDLSQAVIEVIERPERPEYILLSEWRRRADRDRPHVRR